MRRLLSYLIFAAIVTAAGGVLAQEAEEVPEGAETGQAEPPVTSAPGGDESPFDYESSEEISEDLSVSFPVDI